jgi:hypothetical protein
VLNQSSSPSSSSSLTKPLPLTSLRLRSCEDLSLSPSLSRDLSLISDCLKKIANMSLPYRQPSWSKEISASWSSIIKLPAEALTDQDYLWYNVYI